MKSLALYVIALVIGGLIFVFAEKRSLLKEGDRAPEFSAKLNTGESVSLADYVGKKNVVLFFYPKDFSAGCTKEVCSYRDNYDEIRRLDAVMLGVSYDDNSSHSAFAKEYRLPFPLISDSDRFITKAFGAARFGGLLKIPKRVTYVIDKQGIVRKVAHHEVAIDNHIKDVIETLRKLE
jgi:thioredoxin-dependent peroxiredoxin